MKEQMNKSMKGRNPDRGPEVREGAHHFDKGYVSDEEHFSPARPFEDDKYRGNEYMRLQNEAVSRDTTKMKRNKFTKIA